MISKIYGSTLIPYRNQQQNSQLTFTSLQQTGIDAFEKMKPIEKLMGVLSMPETKKEINLLNGLGTIEIHSFNDDITDLSLSYLKSINDKIKSYAETFSALTRKGIKESVKEEIKPSEMEALKKIKAKGGTVINVQDGRSIDKNHAIATILENINEIVNLADKTISEAKNFNGWTGNTYCKTAIGLVIEDLQALKALLSMT